MKLDCNSLEHKLQILSVEYFPAANIRILIRRSTLGENRKCQGFWRKKEFHACAMQRFRYYNPNDTICQQCQREFFGAKRISNVLSFAT